MVNTQFSAGNPKERKKIGRPRLWEDLVYLNILTFQGIERIELGRYV